MVLAMLLASGGCGSPAREPVDPAPTGTPPPTVLTATFEVRGAILHVDYELVNEAGEDLVVLNRLPAGLDDDGTSTAHVVGAGAGGRVEVTTRAFAQPEGSKINYVAAPEVGGTVVVAGGSVGGDVEVPWPLRRDHPWGDDFGDGVVTLADPVREVVFCVGVIRRAELPGTREENGPVVTHSAETTRVQHVACSTPFTL
ncbi:hypothetical protein MB27_09965 [Actinoplanes utahensis]|uniref:Uncharacterized protein n=1 Tax=Actinoplanes utahensis TaxID=1869 RepID=A0A0A6XBI0_ACTUT|nr:hypothetical protein MB27_09965 [Actinoplanes utahensis]